MDAEELKVVLEELHRLKDETVIRINNDSLYEIQRRAEEVCVKHGGHEYVSRSKHGYANHRVECKFCDKIEE